MKSFMRQLIEWKKAEGEKHGTWNSRMYRICSNNLHFICLIGSMHNRNSGEKRGSQNDTHYIVRVPSALKYVYMIMFILGIILFVVFFLFKVKGNASVTTGHLWFSLIFAGIGLLVMMWATRWSVHVDGSEMEICKMFRGKTKVSIQDIGSVEVGKKEELILYDQGGKKLLTIDGLSDNYDRFVKSLKTYRKITKISD